jgi:ABC transporter DrrB family efflux protein
MNDLASSVPAVRVGGVVKRFGATVALDGAGLEVPAGMVFGLLGPNGAGKTTLVRILATLLAPDAGRVEVFGHDVAGEPAAVRELIGLTGQFAAVDELLTGRENLEMFGRLFELSGEDGRRRAGELLERFDLAQAADRPARTYSGGMRRRLDIASSLLTRPRVLFLDEPTTGLDPRSRNEIWAIVRELQREGTTLLLTTQYLEEADQLAGRIAVIDRGKVIAEGTGNELKDRVGGQILEVELSSAGQRDRARALLAGVGCGEPQPDERPGRLTLPAPRDGLELVEEAAAGLRRAQIGVSDIGLRRPTLDDVFLQLTGAPPSEDGGRSRQAAGERITARASGEQVRAPRRPVLRLKRPSPRAVRSAATDTAVVTGRNLRHFIRQPDLLVFSTIQPVLFVLLFVYVFGGAVGRSLPHGVAYVDFLLPGVFVQSVTFGASQTAVGLSEDLERGVVDRFRSMPMARSAVLAGRTVADLVRNIVVIFLMIAVGYLVGFRFTGGVAGAAGCIAVVAAFGFALSWIFAVVALTVRGAEAAQTAGFVVIFPLVFASSVFVPVSTMPDWLQAFAKISPVTVTADAAARSPSSAPPRRWEQQRHGSAACWPYSSPCPYGATGRSAKPHAPAEHLHPCHPRAARFRPAGDRNGARPREPAAAYGAPNPWAGAAAPGSAGLAGRLARFGDDLVEHRRAGELLPAGLGDDAPKLICAVRGTEVRLRLPVRDVHPPVLSVGGDGAVQPQGDEPRLGCEVPGGLGPQFVECFVPAGTNGKAVHQRYRPGEDVIGCRCHAVLCGDVVRRHGYPSCFRCTSVQ